MEAAVSALSQPASHRIPPRLPSLFIPHALSRTHRRVRISQEDEPKNQKTEPIIDGLTASAASAASVKSARGRQRAD